jgi:hypothetical protein
MNRYIPLGAFGVLRLRPEFGDPRTDELRGRLADAHAEQARRIRIREWKAACARGYQPPAIASNVLRFGGATR